MSLLDGDNSSRLLCISTAVSITNFSAWGCFMEQFESQAEPDPTDDADEPDNLSDGDHVEHNEVGDENYQNEFATLANDGSDN